MLRVPEILMYRYCSSLDLLRFIFYFIIGKLRSGICIQYFFVNVGALRADIVVAKIYFPLEDIWQQEIF